MPPQNTSAVFPSIIRTSRDPPAITPLPKRQFGILLLTRFAGPVSFSILFPFVYFMVKDFHISENEKVIGVYVGFLTSCFALAQCVSSILWGTVSDRIGRRPVILVGLLGSAVSMTMFGLSPGLTWAMVTRALAGLLNGNMGVIKTMAAELTDDSNRAQGFTLLPLVFGLGSMVGPVLGGFLSHPADKFPSIFGHNQFFKDKPYFLPCGISALLSFIIFVFAFLYLEETLEGQCEDLLTVEEESRRLLDTNTSSYQGVDQEVSKLKCTHKGSIPIKSWWVISGFMLLNLQFVMLDELFPLWAATSIKKGGLGFDSNHIGTVLSLGGLALILLQLSFYPRAQRKFGTLNLFRYGFYLAAIVLPLFPIIASFQTSLIFWPGLLLIYCFLMGSRVTLFTSSNILLAETCPNKRILGKVNGISQSLSSLMRGIGPILGGVLFSLALHLEDIFPNFPVTILAGLSWFVVGFFSLINSFIPIFIQSFA